VWWKKWSSCTSGVESDKKIRLHPKSSDSATLVITLDSTLESHCFRQLSRATAVYYLFFFNYPLLSKGIGSRSISGSTSLPLSSSASAWQRQSFWKKLARQRRLRTRVNRKKKSESEVVRWEESKSRDLDEEHASHSNNSLPLPRRVRNHKQGRCYFLVVVMVVTNSSVSANMVTTNSSVSANMVTTNSSVSANMVTTNSSVPASMVTTNSLVPACKSNTHIIWSNLMLFPFRTYGTWGIVWSVGRSAAVLVASSFWPFSRTWMSANATDNS